MYKPAKFVAAAQHLQWIHVLSAGFDGILSLPEVCDRRIAITATKGIHGLPIAEHTLGMMLMFVRGLHLLRDRQNRKNGADSWKPMSWQARPSASSASARSARSWPKNTNLLGMKVLGTGPRPHQNENLDHFYLIHDLEQMLAQCDFVALACPLTAATRGMIGEKQLRAMKPTAYLLNLARGAVVDHAALLRALKQAGSPAPVSMPLTRNHYRKRASSGPCQTSSSRRICPPFHLTTCIAPSRFLPKT